MLWYDPHDISIGMAWSYDAILIGTFENVKICGDF
jgi:hypothetical protein